MFIPCRRNPTQHLALLLLSVCLVGALGLLPGHALAQEPAAPAPLALNAIENIPAELLPAIEDALRAGPPLPEAEARWTVSAFRIQANWFEATVVPTAWIEANWDVPLLDSSFLTVIGHQGDDGAWQAARPGMELFHQLAAQVPPDFADPAVWLALENPSASGAAVDYQEYRFPWTGGQTWYRTNGWHTAYSDGNSIDFAPANGSNYDVYGIALAAAAGSLTQGCNDGTQALLRVANGDGSSNYLHLAAPTISNRIGQTISRGDYLGKIYTGHEGGHYEGNTFYQFDTRCGKGTGPHLHWSAPNRSITIDGRSVESVAALSRSVGLVSTNGSGNSGNPGGDTSQDCGSGEGVILYEHTNYGGRCSRFTGDDGNIHDNTIGGDAASSIRIIGNYQAQLFADTNYSGGNSTFTASDSDLTNDAIGGDRTSSLRVARRDSGGSSNCDGGEGVYLYENNGYGGRCTKFTGDSPNPNGWYLGNDAASSLRMVGQWEATLFRDNDYQGGSSRYTGDDDNLGNDAIGNDSVSSLQVRRASSAAPNCGSGDGVYLYENSNYGGRCTRLTADASSPGGWAVGNDAVTSIRIVGAFEATLFQHDNYQGNNTTFTADDPDVGNDAIGNDQVSSVRVRPRSTGPTACAAGQFLAEYYANTTLAGTPVRRECVSSIDYQWFAGGPIAPRNDQFSVRWSGNFWFASEGQWRFHFVADDGFRLWVDSVALLDQWHDMGATPFDADRNLTVGTHRIVVEYYENGGWADAHLSWSLHAANPQNGADSDDGRAIDYGQGLDGTINPAADRDDYYFDGQAGQTITVRMDKRESTLDSFVELYNPDGTLLGRDDDNGGDRNALLRIAVRQNGRHKIIARAYASTATGGYRIALARESVGDPDDGRWITVGGTLRGTIQPNSDLDTYYVNGVAGRMLSLRMNVASGELDSYLELYNAAGVRVAYNDDGGGARNSWIAYTAPATGVYRIVAHSYNLSSTGGYDLLLSSISRTNLALNQASAATSTEFAGVESAKAFDGNLQTRWSSRFADPQLIYVDLGSVKQVNQVVLRWEAAYARTFGIFRWTGSEWQSVYWTTSGDGGTDTISFTPVQTRYIAMYGTQRGTSYGYSLYEFEVYDNSSLPLPLVPPDPEDKGQEPPPAFAPLPPNDEDKATPLVGEGVDGQESLSAQAGEPASLTATPDAGRPVAFILYPRPALATSADDARAAAQSAEAEAAAAGVDAIVSASDAMLFQGEGVDNDDTPAITNYRWSSNVSGVLSTQPVFETTAATLSLGRHIITFEVQDNEGNWSEPAVLTLMVIPGGGSVTWLPLIQQ